VIEGRRYLFQAAALRALSASTSLNLEPSLDSSILYVFSDPCPSVNCVVVVERNTMGPVARDVLPFEVFDGIEKEMDCMVRSCELMPRPTRTMISENCAEEL